MKNDIEPIVKDKIVKDRNKRFLCAYFPEWHTDIYINQILKKLQTKQHFQKTEYQHYRQQLRQRPLALTEQKHSASLIARCNTPAKQHGIATGQSTTMARALAPNLLCEPWQMLYDYQLLYQVSLWAHQYTPLVGIDNDISEFLQDHNSQGETLQNTSTLPPSSLYNGLIFDLTGTESLYRSERNLARHIYHALSQAGYQVKIACAPTIGAAWAASRYLHDPFVELYSHNMLDILSKLPCKALRLSQRLLNELSEVDINTIGNTLAIPIKHLKERYAPLLLERLDQLRGYREEPFKNTKDTQEFFTERLLEVPLSQHNLLAELLGDLLIDLVGQLQQYGLVSNLYTIKFTGSTVQGELFHIEKSILLHSATSHHKHLLSILYPFVEKLHIPGRIEHIRITAHANEARLGKQVDLVNNHQSLEESIHLEQFLNTLVSHLGHESIQYLHHSSSYVPEKSFSFQSKTNSHTAHQERIHIPPHVLCPPEPVDALALLPDKAPHWIQHLNQRMVISKSYGPERVRGEWWQASESSTHPSEDREYFHVQTEGGEWLWIFRDRQDMQWYIHGRW